jgi:hypothetical protein
MRAAALSEALFVSRGRPAHSGDKLRIFEQRETCI